MPRPAPPSPQARPLRALPASRLQRSSTPRSTARDGWRGRMCVHELVDARRIRGVDRGAARTALGSAAPPSVPEWLPMQYVDWLPLAYDVAARFRPAARGRHHVYLVLLDFADRRGEPHGVYVGMSGYAPATTLRPAQGGHPRLRVACSSAAWRCCTGRRCTCSGSRAPRRCASKARPRAGAGRGRAWWSKAGTERPRGRTVAWRPTRPTRSEARASRVRWPPRPRAPAAPPCWPGTR